MAYTPHFLLQFGGTLGSGAQEIWSCGIRMYSDDFTGFDEDEYAADIAAPGLAAWMARPTSKISDNAKLTYLKYNMIKADGNYLEQDSNEFVYPGTGVAGGAGPGLLPFQCSVVLTWRTNDASRGYGTVGRIYSPAPYVQTSGGSGLFSPADAAVMATSAAQLLNTLDVGIGGLGTEVLRPHIMSSVNGAHHQIDSVTVDNRVDIQRRRGNALRGAQAAAEVLY